MATASKKDAIGVRHVTFAAEWKVRGCVVFLIQESHHLVSADVTRLYCSSHFCTDDSKKNGSFFVLEYIF